MRNPRGFTLIETLITTLVLVTGLAAVATLFSYSARTTQTNRRRTVAIALLSSKMEELRKSIPMETSQTAEYLVIQADGSVLKTNSRAAPYLRAWKIQSGSPARVTVIVYGREFHGTYSELARVTMLVGPDF
jgi:prepilin-type N-terminal cleavage/methylation domain-containing protein